MLLDISNSHEYARVLLNIVTYNFLLKPYLVRHKKEKGKEEQKTQQGENYIRLDKLETKRGKLYIYNSGYRKLYR